MLIKHTLHAGPCGCGCCSTCFPFRLITHELLQSAQVRVLEAGVAGVDVQALSPAFSANSFPPLASRLRCCSHPPTTTCFGSLLACAHAHSLCSISAAAQVSPNPYMLTTSTATRDKSCQECRTQDRLHRGGCAENCQRHNAH